MDSQWYYLKDNRPEGPIGLEDLQKMFSHGFLTAKTKVWIKGMPGWVNASEIENLVPKNLASIPAFTPEYVPEKLNFIREGNQVRPWVRFWARLLDVYVFSILTGFILGMINPEWIELFTSHELLFGMLFLLIFPFFEAFMISNWGTTLGKYVLNIRVTSEQGYKLDYHQSLKRSFKVYLSGLLMGIPVVSQIAMIVGYIHLRKNKISQWDESIGSEILHRKINATRSLVVIMMFASIFTLMILSELLLYNQ